MIQLITKQQIAKYEKMPESIPDEDIFPHILDAQQFDTIPVLPDNLLNAVEAVMLSKPQQWNKNKAYVEGNIVWFGDTRKWYKAAADNSNSQPPSDNWEDCELMNFYEQYLQPFIVYHAYYRFFAYHGTNVTQFGLRVINEESSVAVSGTVRADKLGDLSSKRNVAILKISKQLEEISYTLDGTKYPMDGGEKKKLRPKVQIFQVGGRHKTSKRKWDCQ